MPSSIPALDGSKHRRKQEIINGGLLFLGTGPNELELVPGEFSYSSDELLLSPLLIPGIELNRRFALSKRNVFNKGANQSG
jgi:hypothetical protein